jgi:hypothetical protein
MSSRAQRGISTMARSSFVKVCLTTEVTDYTERHGYERRLADAP